MWQKSPLNVTTEMAENVSLSEYLGLFVVSNLTVLDQVQLQYIAINRINLYHWSYQKMLKMLLKIKFLSLSLSFLTFLLSEYRNCLCVLDHPWNLSFGLGGAANVFQGDSLKQMILINEIIIPEILRYIELKKATLWDLKWKCQWYGSSQWSKDMSASSRAKTTKKEEYIFHHLKKFSSRFFSSWWLLIMSQWLHVWVASLCYLHPKFSS